jgi:hypothetical protein
MLVDEAPMTPEESSFITPFALRTDKLFDRRSAFRRDEISEADDIVAFLRPLMKQISEICKKVGGGGLHTTSLPGSPQ